MKFLSIIASLRRGLVLSRIDPLGAGLAEEIAIEQAEPDAMNLSDQPDSETLSSRWATIDSELEKDPDWFTFADEG